MAASTATVIVPTHSGGERLAALLASLRRQDAEHQLIVVDNDSTDETREVLAAHPEAEVVRSETNLGFGRAVNLAAARADGEAIVLVNDDCVCDPAFVSEIAAPLGGDTVMAAGVLADPGERGLIDTAGMQLDPTLLVFDYLHGEPLAVLAGAPDPIGPSAAAAAFDRAAFLEAGGFDEALFAYWEDVDLVLRLRAAGGKCVLARRATGTHMHSATLGSGSREKNALMGFGRGYVLRKWSVLRGARALRALAVDAVICLGQLVIDRNAAGITSRVRGYRAARAERSYPGALLEGGPSAGAFEDLARRLRRRRAIRGKQRRWQKVPASVERETLSAALGAETPAGRQDPGLGARLTTPLPDPVCVGAGTVVFLGGTVSGTADPRRLELAVDGVPSPEPVRAVAPGGDPAFWWTLLPLPARAAPGSVALSLAAPGLPAAQLGELRLDPGRPQPTAGKEVEAAVRAAGPGGPLVAVCMATFDPEPALFASQVESIRSQSHERWICLIGDDGSGVERLAEMRRIIGDDPRFVLVAHEERAGFYGNFERILSGVPQQADFVALADQDDRWYPSKLESLLDAIGDKDLAYSDMRIVDEGGGLISDTYWSERRNNYTSLASLLVGNTVTGAASMLRAGLLDRALPFPPPRGRSYHDHWLALAAMTGRGIAYVDAPLQDYVQHGGAAQGHAEANAGARYLRARSMATLAPRAAGAIVGRGDFGGWAGRYFGMHTRTRIWARILLLRGGESLTPGRRRILARVAGAEDSPAAMAWLAGRSLRPIWGANEAFGRELLVLTSSLWVRALMARDRLRR